MRLVLRRLVGDQQGDWEHERHFVRVAATAMRRILVSSARGRAAEKRGGGRHQVTWTDEITAGEHETFKMPNLDFRGVPIGIDIRKVVETGITPVINTGIAHRKPGIGQIGAGITAAPMACFVAALEAFAESRPTA